MSGPSQHNRTSLSPLKPASPTSLLWDHAVLPSLTCHVCCAKAPVRAVACEALPGLVPPCLSNLFTFRQHLHHSAQSYRPSPGPGIQQSHLSLELEVFPLQNILGCSLLSPPPFRSSARHPALCTLSWCSVLLLPITHPKRVTVCVGA